MIEYRTMVEGDIEAGLSLCRHAGWNQLSRDWEIFLQLSPHGCMVAVNGGKVVGTVTTINYETKFGWIGMVLVDPNYQRQGIGMQILKEGIKILQEQESIKLDATAAGRLVYLKLGFADEYHLSRMQMFSGIRIPVATLAEPVSEDDLLQLTTFDSRFFGAGRHALIEWMWEGGHQFSFIVRQDGEIQGYCLGREGYNYTHIGPLVAHDLSIAKELLTAVIQKCPDRVVVLDVPHMDPEWRQWLTSLGFFEQRQFIRMYKNVNNNPGEPQKQFAIMGPEFG